jgi:hypothetical protein
MGYHLAMRAHLSAADIHLHTDRSDGLASPRAVLDWVCAKTDLAVIAITDHNTVDGAHEAAALAAQEGYPVDVIIGQEVDSSQGHIIGLWAPERVEPGASAADTVAAIHAQGGIAVAAHPFAPRFWAKHGLYRGERAVYDSVGFDAFEISNSTPLMLNGNWRARLYLLENHHRFAATGGSDAHILPAIGASRTLFPGQTASDLRRAIVERTTRVGGGSFWLARNLRYAQHLPLIIDRERRAEAELEEAARRSG